MNNLYFPFFYAYFSFFINNIADLCIDDTNILIKHIFSQKKTFQ
jgi:hypothetical protein